MNPDGWPIMAIAKSETDEQFLGRIISGYITPCYIGILGNIGPMKPVDGIESPIPEPMPGLGSLGGEFT